MKHPDDKEIYRLIKKLEDEGDITPKEANRIFSLFSEKSLRTRFNRYSSKYDYNLTMALSDWFFAVSEKIRKGKRGNFIFTITFDDAFNEILDQVKYTIKKHGTFEDLCDVIMIDEKTYSDFPFKHLFFEGRTRAFRNLYFERDKTSKNYYKMRSLRAGMYYYPLKTKAGTCTIKQAMEKLSPVTTRTLFNELHHVLIETAFKIASGVSEVPPQSSIPLSSFIKNQETIKTYVLAAFIRHKNIGCAVVKTRENQAALFADRENARDVRTALGISLEDLARNALRNGIIDKTTAGNLLNNAFAHQFPMRRFAKTSVEYLDAVIQRRKEWEAGREAVKNEDAWLEQTR